MTVVAQAVAAFGARIGVLSGVLGRRVAIDADEVLDRSPFIVLAPPGRCSPNGSCRLLRAVDGWVAVNLPRESDFELIPAWVGGDTQDAGWARVEQEIARRGWREVVADARLLGLPVAGVQEMAGMGPGVSLHRLGAGGRTGRLNVVDLSSLWAGPLCGGIFSRMGAEVTKIESLSRPDPTRAMPGFHARLNGGKRDVSLDFSDPADRAVLRQRLVGADVVITSARLRAFEQLGLAPQEIFAANPALVWVAVSGYGWTGDAADRVAFGDDAAAAGGLVRWGEDGVPGFGGDALADPLSGLAAAAGALSALSQGGGYLVDVAMAQVAAGVAG